MTIEEADKRVREAEETWRPIPISEGWFAEAYEVSDRGRVRSLDRLVECRGRLMPTKGALINPRRNKHGYLQVRLRWKGKKAVPSVHSLVLHAFVGQRPNGQEARHLNGIKEDCRVSNLAWGTHTENMADQRRHGTLYCGERHASAKLTAQEVSQIREKARSGETFAALSRKYGTDAANIARICKGTIWRTGLSDLRNLIEDK